MDRLHNRQDLGRASTPFPPASARGWRLLRRYWYIAALTVALLSGWTWSCVMYGPNGWVVYQKKKAELRQLHISLQQLQRENDALARHVKGLRADPRVIEDEAIKKGYVRPGARVYVLSPTRDATGRQPLAGGSKVPTQPGFGAPSGKTAASDGRVASMRAMVVLTLVAIVAGLVFHRLWLRRITKRER